MRSRAASRPAPAEHSAVNETLCRRARSHRETKPFYLWGQPNTHKEGGMRAVIFGAILIAVAAVGFQILISSSLAAARHAKAATFSERFDAVLQPAERK